MGFYRIQAIDKDGKISYSETKQIRLNQLTNKPINVFPNPAKDVVTINCVSAKNLLILDYLGRIMYQKNNPLEKQRINTKQFAKGVYIVQVITKNNEVKNQKLIVE